MPWSDADAPRFTHKASTPELRALWAAAANGALAAGKTDGEAVTAGNSAVKHSGQAVRATAHPRPGPKHGGLKH